MMGLAVALGGCASQPAGRQADAKSPVQSGVVAQPQTGALRSLPDDDPSEPWSPNYGTRPRVHDAMPARDLPAVYTGPTRLATVDDADAVIRQAIAEHEMRRP